MATPSLSRHRLPGYLGDILVDVRTGDRVRPRPAVLVVHGFKGFKDWGMFPPLAERLARAGFTAVSLNLGGSGVDDSGEFVFPERFARATYSGDLGDLQSVLDATRQGGLGFAPASSVGIVGHSRGGGLAILAAAADPGLSALVTWAAISTVHRYSPDEIAAWRARGSYDVVNTRTGQVLPMGTDVLDDIASRGAALDIAAAAAHHRALAAPPRRGRRERPGGRGAALHAASGAGRAAPRPRRRTHLRDGASLEGPTAAFTTAADATLAWFSRHLR